MGGRLARRGAGGAWLGTLIVSLLPACAEESWGPLYEVDVPADGSTSIVEVEFDPISMRFRLDIPAGTRGFLIYCEGDDPAAEAGVADLVSPAGETIIDTWTFEFGDEDIVFAREGGHALAMPNHDIDVESGGVWKFAVGADTTHVEVWAARRVDAPVRYVDVVAHMGSGFIGDRELEEFIAGGLEPFGFTLGTLEFRQTESEFLWVPAEGLDEEFESIPREDAPVLNVLIYPQIDGLGGKSGIAGLPRGGSRSGALAVDVDAGPVALGHEIGHFLGLYHPTSSMHNDLLESTPPCATSLYAESPEDCPNQDNLMTAGTTDSLLTDEQLRIAHSSVLWHP